MALARFVPFSGTMESSSRRSFASDPRPRTGSRMRTRPSPAASTCARSLDASAMYPIAAATRFATCIFGGSPVSSDALASTTRRTTTSSSARNSLSTGSPVRAKASQSMRRRSSPGAYGRCSRNSALLPRRGATWSPPAPERARTRSRLRSASSSRVNAGSSRVPLILPPPPPWPPAPARHPRREGPPPPLPRPRRDRGRRDDTSAPRLREARSRTSPTGASTRLRSR